MTQKPQCSNCVYSKIKYDSSNRFESMECRIKPPKATRMMAGAYWPKVDPHDWCGKHASEEPK